MTTVDATTDATLELDDIQAGALFERPSPYVGTYLLLRIARPRRRPRAGPATAPDRQPRRRRRRPPDETSITVAFTYHGLKALGVPQASLDSFAPGVPGGDGGPGRDPGRHR